MVVAFVVSHGDYIGDSLCGLLYCFVCSDAFAYKCYCKRDIMGRVFWIGENVSV